MESTMESILNNVTSTISPSPEMSGKITFREDGLRQPPLYTASSNLIIMIMGLSILIIPVVCFVICMCPRTRIFESLRNIKSNSNGKSSKLPYSQFDSENSEPNPKVQVPKDVRVLIHSDNAVLGSPKYSHSGNEDGYCNVTKQSTALKPSASSSSLEFSNVDLDPTFVIPGGNSSFHHSDDDNVHYP